MAGDNAIIDNDYSGNSGSDILVAPLTNSTKAKIELAFWVRATKSTSSSCATSTPFGKLQEGEVLSVPNAQLSNAPFSESGTGICNLVSYSVTDPVPASVPAYKFVVYYTTTPSATSEFKGPKILYRWESGVVPISYADFGYVSSSEYSKIPPKNASGNSTWNPAATNVWVLNPPALGGGVAISDYLATTTPVKIANSPTNPQSVTVSIQGSMDNVQGNVDYKTK
ncbi:MAG TPA: hypothetical protein VIJ25_11660, partial [Methylococcales bacterium]